MSADVTLDLSRIAMGVVQTVTAVGMVACVGLLIRLDRRVALIEAQQPTLLRVDERTGAHETKIGEHGVRLDGHDRELREVKRSQAIYTQPQRGVPEPR